MNLETIFEKQLANSNPLCDSVWYILVDGNVFTEENSRIASHPVKKINTLEITGYEHKITYGSLPLFYKVL